MTATLTPPAYPAATTITRNEAERVLNKLAVNVTRRKTLEAEIAGAALAKRREHETELTRLESKIEAGTETMHAYAEANPELFEKKKTLEMGAGEIGFRAGQPSVTFREGWDEAKAIEAVKALKPSLREQFINVVVSLRKRAFISMRDKPDFLDKLGVVITSEEKFFVKTNA